MAQATAAPPRKPSTSTSHTGGRAGTAVIGAGAVLAGGGALMMVGDVPAQTVAVCAAPPLAVVGFARWRASRRSRVTNDLTQALAPLAGAAAVVKCSKWARREYVDPKPQRIEIRYQPEARDGDPKWVEQVLSVVGARVGHDYEVDAHPSHRKRILLTQAGPSEKAAEDDTPRGRLQERAEVTMLEMLGKESRAKYQWGKDENLEGIEVRYPDTVAVKLTSRMKRQQIERVVTAMLPGRWRAQWDLEASRAHFELRPALPEGVSHPKPVITDANRYRIPTGVTEDGDTTFWDLKSTLPHGLTNGKTGTGKTVDIMGIVMEFAFRKWPCWISDPKQIEFLGVKKWPNVQIVAITIEQQMAMIVRAWELMEKRYTQIATGADERDFEPLLVVLDEFADLRSAITHWWAENKHKGAPAKCPIFGMIGSLARKARSAKIHLYFGTQRPDAEILSGEVRDNLGFRHSLGRLSVDGARMMWGAPYIGTSVPSKIPGRGIAMDDEGEPVESQSYWTPDPRRALRDRKESDLEILRNLLPEEITHKRLDIEFDDEDAATWLDEGGKSTYTPWGAIIEATFRTAGDADEIIDLDAEPEEQDVADDPPEEMGVEFSRLDRHLHLVTDDLETEDDDYGPSQNVPADRIKDGDLVYLDDQWVVVECAEADLEDDGMISLSWRSDEDEAGEVALDADEVMDIRRITEDKDDEQN
ncbi:FtsK/SpoIIIE domain-containing protein [Brachybacterium kimchii]|uniref:FtsK domain-containing protein n=1 Tax=Brachybacterium kimchii TaxID=2942909 RepID=A0ABY4NDQ9_9MICO|nr:FtsK/SpoIIIE domain-containing protein [Brachybacterium kimchii]UQN31805.1 hypothetical protein M4486_19640 [Brachybacterium kimchii]